MIILYTFRLLGYFQYALAFNQNTLQKNMHQNFQQQPSIVTPVQKNESGGIKYSGRLCRLPMNWT